MRDAIIVDARLEKWVRRLTPPASREEVLGDLAERCRTPRQYLAEALRTLPFVIGSRIRRTTHPLGVLVAGAFLYWAVFWGAFQAHWVAALVPTALVLAVLALRDAYRAPEEFARLPRVGLVDAAWVALAVLASQLLLRNVAAGLALTLPTLLIGFPLGLTLLYFGRLQSPAGFHQPPGFARRISLQELRSEIDVYERTIRRAVRIELWACATVAIVFLLYTLFLKIPPIGRTGTALTVAGALFIAWYLRRHAAVRPISRELDFSGTLAAYRADIARRMQIGRGYLWWYLLPIMTGPAIWIVGGALLEPGGKRRAIVAAAVFIAIALVMRLLPKAQIARAKRRFDQLAQVSEKIVESGA